MPVVTVAIQLDACRADYFNEVNTPFLQGLIQEGLSGRVAPTFGFEPDAAYLAGLYPDEADAGMHFCYASGTSVFRFGRFLPPGLDRLPDILQKIIRRLFAEGVRRTTNSSRIKYLPHSSRIPFSMMRYFDIAEKHLFTEIGYLQGRGIFNAVRKQNKSFLYLGAPTQPTSADLILKEVKAKSVKNLYDLIFLHIGDLDAVGHRFGPRSKEIAETLQRIDSVLSTIWTHLELLYGEINFVLIGDHGMAEVREIVDIGKLLKKTNLKIGKDYLYFLDSTFARFWFCNGKARHRVSEILHEVGKGHILTQEEKNRYHLNYPHNKYGDLIFLVDPGVLIFPNFWNIKTSEKGMHGYAPEHPGQQSGMLIHSHRIEKPLRLEEPFDMRRIFPTLLEFLDLPMLENTTAQSLL
jgi:predicted AlkP superfamily pyrophosphatase or phosphodiesterase